MYEKESLLLFFQGKHKNALGQNLILEIPQDRQVLMFPEYIKMVFRNWSVGLSVRSSVFKTFSWKLNTGAETQTLTRAFGIHVYDFLATFDTSLTAFLEVIKDFLNYGSNVF